MCLNFGYNKFKCPTFENHHFKKRNVIYVFKNKWFQSKCWQQLYKWLSKYLNMWGGLITEVFLKKG